jgi:hypothetical protein
MAPIRVSRGGIFDLGSRGRRQTSRKIRRWQDPSDWGVQIDAEGRVLGGKANRPRTEGKSVVEMQWLGAFNEYRLFDRRLSRW